MCSNCIECIYITHMHVICHKLCHKYRGDYLLPFIDLFFTLIRQNVVPQGNLCSIFYFFCSYFCINLSFLLRILLFPNCRSNEYCWYFIMIFRADRRPIYSSLTLVVNNARSLRSLARYSDVCTTQMIYFTVCCMCYIQTSNNCKAKHYSECADVKITHKGRQPLMLMHIKLY